MVSLSKGEPCQPDKMFKKIAIPYSKYFLHFIKRMATACIFNKPATIVTGSLLCRHM